MMLWLGFCNGWITAAPVIQPGQMMKCYWSVVHLYRAMLCCWFSRDVNVVATSEGCRQLIKMQYIWGWIFVHISRSLFDEVGYLIGTGVTHWYWYLLPWQQTNLCAIILRCIYVNCLQLFKSHSMLLWYVISPSLHAMHSLPPVDAVSVAMVMSTIIDIFLMYMHMHVNWISCMVLYNLCTSCVQVVFTPALITAPVMTLYLHPKKRNTFLKL